MSYLTPQLCNLINFQIRKFSARCFWQPFGDEGEFTYTNNVTMMNAARKTYEAIYLSNTIKFTGR